MARKSHDDENKSNEDLARFLFPMFRKVTPYALRNAFSQKVDGIAKEDSYFSTTLKGKTYPFATIKNRIINQDEKGYVYVFLRDETMIKDNDSYQYRCYHELVPIDIIEVRFKDFVDDFEIIQDNEKIKHSNLQLILKKLSVFKVNGKLVRMRFSENTNLIAADCLTRVLENFYRKCWQKI